MILIRKWEKERGKKKDQKSAPLTTSSSKKTIYRTFSEKLGRHYFFLSSGTDTEYIMYRKILELDFTPV